MQHNKVAKFRKKDNEIYGCKLWNEVLIQSNPGSDKRFNAWCSSLLCYWYIIHYLMCPLW